MLLNTKRANRMIFAAYNINKAMKRIIIICAIALMFASCEKESNVLECEITETINYDNTTHIGFVINNSSDIGVYAKISFNLNGEYDKTEEFDRRFYAARSESEYYIDVNGIFEYVDYKIEVCE